MVAKTPLNSPGWGLDVIWPWLTRPSPAIRPEHRRQAQLLSLLLALLVLFWIAAGIIPYILRYPGHPYRDHFFQGMIVIVLALTLCYALSRTARYPLAAALTIGMTSLSIFTAAATAAQADKGNLLVYLVIPILLSSILLSPRATILITALQLAGMLLFHALIPGTPSFGTWLAFVFSSSALILVTTYHQALMEKDRQAELATERNLLLTVIDHLPDQVLVKDTQHHYLLGNTTAARLLGAVSPAGLAGKTDSDLYPPEYAARCRADDERIMQSGTPVINREELAPESPGSPQWRLTTKVPLRSSSGQVVGLVGVGRDITDRKKAELALARHLQRLDILHSLEQGVLAGLSSHEIAFLALESLCSVIPCFRTAVVLFNFDDKTAWTLLAGTQTRLNVKQGRYLPLSGFRPAELAFQTDASAVDDLARLAALNPVQEQLVAEGAHAYLSIPLFVEDQMLGQLNLAAGTSAAIGDESVEIAWELANQLATALHHVDLREQLHQYAATLEKRVEQRTAELERLIGRVEAILNNSSDAIILTYANGLMTQTNPMFDDLFGYARGETFHRPLADLLLPEHRDALNQALAAVIQTNQIQHLEVVALRKDQSTFHAEIGLSPVRSGDDLRGGIVCNLRDISARKQAEVQLLVALEKEKELSELRSRFVSMVSHEFRTPLTSIISSSELLEHYLDRMDAGQKAKHFEKIRGSIRYMTQLLDDTLILGRTESGRQRLNPQVIDLEQLSQDILEEIQPEAAPTTRYVCATSGDCRHVVLDEKLLRHILSNLLSNATKYSPHGGTVRVDLCCDDDGTTIRVSDQGIGIPRSDQDRLFEPFHRGDNVENIRGTGLGLAITQRAVSLHNGSIRFTSEVGVGTTFVVTLPNALHSSA